MNVITIVEIQASEGPVLGGLRVQCLACEKAETNGGKPFYKLTLSDGTATLCHCVWSDAPGFNFAVQMRPGACYELSGAWEISKFGLECTRPKADLSCPQPPPRWDWRMLSEDETAELFAGPVSVREKQERDWVALVKCVDESPSGPLRSLMMYLLDGHEKEFRRAAAARGNHHARRGGLVEHVSLMAQAAVALCGVYPELRRELLVAGVVFHDVGKIVENQYQEEGFEMPFSFAAECYGHIAVGVLMAHKLWKRLPEEVQRSERPQLDALCHLILSHHGQLEWGSPVEPKLPEAAMLHFIDNMDAKLEMMRAARKTGKRVAEGVIERSKPFGYNLLVLE